MEFILLVEASVEVGGESGVPAIAGHDTSIPPSQVFNGIQCTSHEDEPTGCTIIIYTVNRSGF